MNEEIDVRHALATVRVPTLVLYRAQEYLREAAATWARGSRAPRWSRCPAPITCRGRATRTSVLATIETSSAACATPPTEPNLILTTVLRPTCPRPSTRRCARRSARFRGQPLDAPPGRMRRASTGPPARSAAPAALAGSFPPLRAGVHTGECELRDGRLIGPALEIAAGVARAAAPGEILATSTVADLVAGSGIEFSERGAVELPLAGDSREWRLFARYERDYRTFTGGGPFPTAARSASTPMAQMISTIRNGVDTQQLFGTLDTIADQPELGAFTFRAANRWINGAHNRSRIQGFYGAGQEDDGRARGVRGRRRRAAGAARHRLRPERRRVPAARARRLPDDDDRLQRRGAQDPPDRGRVDRRGRHGRARVLRVDDGVRNGFSADPREFRVAGDAPTSSCRRSSRTRRRAPRCST